MMPDVTFQIQQSVITRFCMVSCWEEAFRFWCEAQPQFRQCQHLVVVTDAKVWELYERRTCAGLAPLNKMIVPVVLPPGEDSKNFETLSALVDDLVANHVHRRDLLICLGGGVVCDFGGLLALLYLRGLPYINVPTSLMAQIDAAIGGKVGANFGLRKNLLGGFHHPLLVLLELSFLASVPDEPYVSAFAEALKVAMILQDDRLLAQLESDSEELLRRDPVAVTKVVEQCIQAKMALLRDDPFEVNLDRVLNLGHGVAHALERLAVMSGLRQPLHGEAVAIGLAAKVRYAFRMGLCGQSRAQRFLRIMKRMRLPLQPAIIPREEVREQLNRIQENRGGLFRLVLPVDPVGVGILPKVDLDLLVECLMPVADLG